MKNIIFLFILFVILSLSQKSYSQEDRWIYLDSFDKTDYIGTFYYDKTTIEYYKNFLNENVVKIWIKKTYNYTNPNIDLKNMLINEIVLWEINCNSKKLTETYVTYYFNNGNNASEDIFKEHKIVPGTIGEYVYNMFCK
ncbi:MAG: hypothetical protein NTU73_05830 [Ignavibacteriae bacterium]|nr:hypothetical protein [Ignavibacteriota bacterium]